MNSHRGKQKIRKEKFRCINQALACILQAVSSVSKNWWDTPVSKSTHYSEHDAHQTMQQTFSIKKKQMKGPQLVVSLPSK